MYHVTVLGLQRSGTNFLEKCIANNFKDISIQNMQKKYLWKHCYGINLKEIKDDKIHVWVYKNPYTWIESVLRYSADVKKRYPHVAYDSNIKNDDGIKHGEFDVVELAKLWNEYHEFWLRKDVIKKAKYYRIKYEDLISSDDATKEFLLSLPLRQMKDVIDIPEKVPQSRTFDESMREKYTKIKIDVLTPYQISAINGVLDQEIMKELNYDFLQTHGEEKCSSLLTNS